MKFITALAIVAALSCAALAAFEVPAVHSAATAFHKPDKPVFSVPSVRFEQAYVLQAYESASDVVMADLHAQQPVASRSNISTLAVAETVKTKGCAPFLARTFAVARSTI